MRWVAFCRGTCVLRVRCDTAKRAPCCDTEYCGHNAILRLECSVAEPLRLYSWVWFEPTMGTPLAPLRGLRPDFFRWPCCSRPSALFIVFVWLVRTKWCPRNARGRGGIGRLTRSQFWPKSHRTPRFGALPNDSCHDTLLGAVRRGGYAAFAPANATFLFLATGRRPCQNYRFITYTFRLLSI